MPRSNSVINNGRIVNSTGGSSSNNRKGTSRVVIRPYRKPPALPANYYEDTVKQIFEECIAKKQNLQQAYTQVVHLTSHNFGPRLYGDLRQHLCQIVEQLLSTTTTTTFSSNSSSDAMTDASPVVTKNSAVGKPLLQYIPTQYQEYLDYLLLCRHVFLPLDRTHGWNPTSQTAVPKRSTQTWTMWQVGLNEFAQRMTNLKLDTALYQEWLQALLDDWNSSTAVSKAANTTTTTTASSWQERYSLQAVCYLWQDLGKLPTVALQADLEKYWSARSKEWLSNYDISQFLQFAYEKHQHVQLWQPYLPSNFLWSILDYCLFAPHLNESYLLNPTFLHPLLLKTLQVTSVGQDNRLMSTTGPGSSGTMDSVKNSSIHQLWMLSSRIVGGQVKVAVCIAQFVRVQGLQCLPKPPPKTESVSISGPPQSSASQVVIDLLDLQDRTTSLLKRLPKGTELVVLKNVWEEVANQDSDPSVAELLAKYLDQVLKSNKKVDELQSKSDQWLQKIIFGLFVPLQAKDIFEGFYKRDLAKRLLWNRIVSMDLEKQVCSLLKAECGSGFTSKMEGMFQDMDGSRETMMLYKETVAANKSIQSPVDVEVQVLTTGYWPIYAQHPNLKLPQTLVEPQEHFAEYYKTKYQGRRMTWQYALGHCLVKCNGFSKPYELLISLCQALVLEQFETAELQYTLPELMQRVGMGDRDEMERILQSLSMGREGTRILRKLDYDIEPGNKKKLRYAVDDRDKFTINTKFESKSRRIRIINISAKETKEERDKTVEAVSRDRLYLIDAVLVRIMKSRKTVLHQELIVQVLEQVKVPAQPADIKKRIESLIEREYMERDAQDRSRYNYLA